MALYDHIKKMPMVPPPGQFGPPPPSQYGPPPPVPVQSSLFNGLGVKYQDLYPYSPADSNLWLELFIIADRVDNDFAVRLEWLRAVGANLVLDEQFGFRIQPIVDPTGTNGWESQQHYELERGCLEPYYQQVIDALGELRRRYNSGKIR